MRLSSTLLVKAGADAKAVSTTGSTPLMLAASAGAVEAVKRLLDAGADVNAKESARGQTALMFAAANNRVPVVRLLAERGADLETTTKVVDLFEVSAARGSGVPPRGADGSSGAAQASGARRRARLQLSRADRQPGRRDGVALRGAAGLPRDGAGARRRRRRRQPARAATGASPLLVAAINGHFDLAKFLLEQGRRIRSSPPRTARRRSTPCSTASGRRRPTIRSRGRSSSRRRPISR